MQKEPVTIRCSGKEVNESCCVKKPAEPLRQKQKKKKKNVSGQTEQSERKTPQQKHRARMTEKVHMHTQQELNTEKKQEKQYIFNSGLETRKHAGKTGSRAS